MNMKILSKKLCCLNGSTESLSKPTKDVSELEVFLHLDYEIDNDFESKSLMNYKIKIGFNEDEPIFIIAITYKVCFIPKKEMEDSKIIEQLVQDLHPDVMNIVHLFINQSNLFQ